MEFENLGLRFVRWGTGLLMLGLMTGYGPLGHYLGGGVAIACPWAPVHAHVALLGWVGMTLFGLVYRELPSWANGAQPAHRLAGAHFYCCVASVFGVCMTPLDVARHPSAEELVGPERVH